MDYSQGIKEEDKADLSVEEYDKYLLEKIRIEEEKHLENERKLKRLRSRFD